MFHVYLLAVAADSLAIVVVVEIGVKGKSRYSCRIVWVGPVHDPLHVHVMHAVTEQLDV